MIHFRFIAGILIASVLLGVTKIDFFRIDKPLDPAVLPPNQAVERRSLISEAPSQPASHDITQENSLVYSADIMEGLIGVDENSPVDDPFDNVFHFFLENAPTQTGTVWLQYQLTGVQDHTAVARSINSRQAVGGYLIQNTEEWSFQRERIDPSWLRDGDNVIRFSTHTAIDYTYQVKEVQIVVEDKGGSDRAIVVNQPSNCYFRDQAYLKGFIIGDQSGTPKMFLDGQQINLTDGEFEYLVQKPEGAPDEWQSEIVVQYPDGEEKRTTVHFRSQLHPDMVLPFAQKQTAYTQLLGTDGGELDLPGAKLSVPPRALETEKSILAIPLRTVDLPPLEPDMVNVTKNQAGFRFLPDGMQFASEASLQLDYDPSLIPEGYTADDIRTYFFEEKSRRWIVLKRDSIDEQFSHIISSTSHFTDYINGIIKVPESPRTNAYTPTFIKDLKAADPSTGVIPIEPPAANNMGTANLQYPIKLPAGRLGMQPQVVLRYNSNGDNGWTGLGWECSFSSIGIETRWGVPRYDADLETETYIFDGMQLAPVAHRDDFEPRSTGDKQFFPRVESNFQKIIRHGQNPKNYWWEVIDKEGTRSFFGGRPSSGVDANAVLKDNFGNIAHWAIVETRDLNDNFIRYHYDRVQDPGIPGGVVPGFQLYPRRITYTGNGSNEGKYQVRFVRDQELGENKRPDVSIDARLGFKQVTAALLRKIEVSFNGGLVRSYELEYIEGAFYKTLLSSIIEKDKNGQTFYKHSFEYYDEVRQGNGYQPYKALQNWEVPDEELQGNISNTKQDFTAEVSAIGGSESSNSSIGGAVTFGPPILCGSKEVSVGVNFSSGEGESKGIVILVDINGDNLPDKVFRKNGALFFQPNLSGASSGMNEFGSAQLISGIDHFSQSNSNTSSFGWEANFFFYVGKSESDSESEATTYFADFNGDGLIDVAQDNEVYFNSLDSNGDPAFIPQSDQTPNPIIAGAALDPGLIEVDPQEKENLISKYPLHDVVRVWRAPYEGVITIRDSIKRIPPQTPAGINYAKKDTLKMSIQVGGDEIWSKSYPRQ